MIIIHINSKSTQFTIIFQIWFFLASKNCNWNHKLMHFLCCCSWWVAINRARVFFWCTVLKLTYYLIFTYWWHAKNDSGECRIFWFFFGFWWNATLLRLLWLEHRERWNSFWFMTHSIRHGKVAYSTRFKNLG